MQTDIAQQPPGLHNLNAAQAIGCPTNSILLTKRFNTGITGKRCRTLMGVKWFARPAQDAHLHTLSEHTPSTSGGQKRWMALAKIANLAGKNAGWRSSGCAAAFRIFQDVASCWRERAQCVYMPAIRRKYLVHLTLLQPKMSPASPPRQWQPDSLHSDA